MGGVGRGIDMHRGPTLTAAVRNFSPITPTMSPAFPFLGLAGTSGVATMKKPETMVETRSQHANIMFG